MRKYSEFLLELQANLLQDDGLNNENFCTLLNVKETAK